MRRVLSVVLLIVGGCTSPHETTEHSAPMPGAVLSVEAGAGAAALSVSDIQTMLQTHPTWAAQTLSHGLEPPYGYFVKVKGRCGSLSAAGTEIGHMLTEVAHGPIRCQDVTG